MWNANYFFYIPPEQASAAFDVDLYDWSLLGIIYFGLAANHSRHFNLPTGTSTFIGDTSIPLEDLETDFLQDVWMVLKFASIHSKIC